MKNDLIVLTQAPVINYEHLEIIAEELKERMKKYDLENLVVTEENVKDTKAFRAKLNKEFEGYEKNRIRLKNEMLKPYDEFDEKYKVKITQPYAKAKKDLTKLIDDVENKLRKQKEDEVREYFAEQNVHSFLEYEQLGMKINLSDNVNTHKNTIQAVVANISNDLTIIDTQEHKERILSKYQKTLNLSQSILDTKAEIEREQRIIDARKLAEMNIHPVHEDVLEKVHEDIIERTFVVKGTSKALEEIESYIDQKGLGYYVR